MSANAAATQGPTFLGFSLRSSLTASIVGATCGLGAGFVSIMLLFLGMSDGTVDYLLQMQVLGFALVAAPWAAYRARRPARTTMDRRYWSLIPKWLTTALIVTLGTAVSGQIALMVVAHALDRSLPVAHYLPGVSITAFSLLWTECYVARRKLG